MLSFRPIKSSKISKHINSVIKTEASQPKKHWCENFEQD